MIAQPILHAVFGRIKQGAVRVTYPDGRTVDYGSGTPLNHVTFKTNAVCRVMGGYASHVATNVVQ